MIWSLLPTAALTAKLHLSLSLSINYKVSDQILLELWNVTQTTSQISISCFPSEMLQ